MELTKQDAKIVSSAVQAAYVSGYFDAEGSFTMIEVDGNAYPKIVFYSNCLEQLLYIQKIVGGCLTEVKRAFRSARYGKSFMLCFHSLENARVLCQLLHPWLVDKGTQLGIVYKSLGEKDRLPFKIQLTEANKKAQKFIWEIKPSAQVDCANIQETDWAYLAGWIDGDGSVNLQPQRFKKWVYRYPWITVYSTRPKGLLHLYSIFGGMIRVRSRCDDWAIEGSLQFRDQHYVAKILRGVRPFLIEKSNQVDILLEAIEAPTSEREMFAQVLKESRNRVK